MVRGPHGSSHDRHLWLAAESMAWVSAFAAAMPCLCKGYNHRLKRWEFGLQGVGEVRVLPVAAITDGIWNMYGSAVCDLYGSFVQYDSATLHQKRRIAEYIIVPWCHAILECNEQTFLIEHNFHQ